MTLFEDGSDVNARFADGYEAHLLAHPPTPTFTANPKLCQSIAAKDVKRVRAVLDALGLTITEKPVPAEGGAA